MAEGNTVQPSSTGAAAPADPIAANGGEPGGAGPAEDWKAKYESLLKQSRKNEDRAKANYAKAKAYDDAVKRAEEADGKIGELQGRADKAEAELAALRAERERASIIEEVAREKGVDASLLARMSGDTAEELGVAADALLAAMGKVPIYPTVPDGGAAGSGAGMTREQIDAIKNPGERVRAIASNIHLYQ